ncbi:MAG: OmpA family protein, partial [Polyangia bacterium]
MLRLRLKKPRWFKGLLLSLLFTGACGVSQELYSARTTDLDRCQTELTRSQGDLTTARARSDEEAGAREHAQTVEMEYLKLRQNLKATETQLDELRRARAQAEQRSDLYRSLVSRLKEMIDAKTLAVEIRKGKMLVKLGDAVLFDPGKADLKPTGESALRTVAAALREIPDRDFVIAGHTDNLPIKSSPYRSNWELST